MSAYRSGFDIFDELSRLVPEVRRIVVPKLVKQELAKIARGGGRAREAVLRISSGIWAKSSSRLFTFVPSSIFFMSSSVWGI